MQKIESLIENLTNGNFSEFREGARKLSKREIVELIKYTLHREKEMLNQVFNQLEIILK